MREGKQRKGGTARKRIGMGNGRVREGDRGGKGTKRVVLQGKGRERRKDTGVGKRRGYRAVNLCVVARY